MISAADFPSPETISVGHRGIVAVFVRSSRRWRRHCSRARLPSGTLLSRLIERPALGVSAAPGARGRSDVMQLLRRMKSEAAC